MGKPRAIAINPSDGGAAEALVCACLFAAADHQMPSFDSFFDPELSL
jgi:hypothetical protein